MTDTMEVLGLFKTCPPWRKTVGLVVLLILAGVGIWYWQSTRTPAAPKEATGVKDVTPETLATVLKQGKPGILEFYTTSCPYCKKIEPELAKVNADHGGSVFVVKMNAEKHTQEAVKYQIPGVPTLIFFDGKGNAQAVAAGYRDAAGIVDILKQLKMLQ